jgi:hypothetical protein
MARKAKDILVLGEGSLAGVFEAILRVPVIDRKADDTGWNWPKTPVADKLKLLLLVASHEGLDRTVRHQAEAWNCPKASRIGVVIVVTQRESCEALLERDVFGRKGHTETCFRDYTDVLRVVSADVSSLKEIVENIAGVGFLPIDTWHRSAKNASCIVPLLEAIRERNMNALMEVLPEALNVHWDSICFPISRFPNHHQYANAIRSWLAAVTPSVTPDWKSGLDLIAPLASR